MSDLDDATRMFAVCPNCGGNLAELTLDEYGNWVGEVSGSHVCPSVEDGGVSKLHSTVLSRVLTAHGATIPEALSYLVADLDWTTVNATIPEALSYLVADLDWTTVNVIIEGRLDENGAHVVARVETDLA